MITVVRLYDDEAPTSVSKLWEPEQRRVAATWMPRQTVLLLSNAAFAPLDRLATFVSCSTFLFDTFQQMTVAELRDLSDRGASTEAKVLLTVSVLGTVTSTTLLSKEVVVTVCKMVVGSPGPAWGSWTAPKSLLVSTLTAYLAPDQR